MTIGDADGRPRMSWRIEAAGEARGKAGALYAALEERILDRDQARATVVCWPDQEPLKEPGTLRERLGHWLTLVHRGQVLEAYRIFLGLVQEPAHRREVLAELVFAGLIDLQDRSLNNRSYTTGHKAFRARATVELATAIGWEAAHAVVYT